MFIPNRPLLMPGPTGTATAPAKDKGRTTLRPLPFTRAALEHVEGAFVDESTVITTATQQKGPHDVPAFGYMRGIWLLVEATGGDDQTGGDAAAAPDGPWNVLQEIALLDVNGAPIIGPFDGYDLFQVNKWGGIGFDDDPTRSPAYSAVAAATGNFSFLLYLPVETVGRDALGALANMNSSSTYKLRYTLNTDAVTYSTVPDTTLPTVRVRAYLDAWSKPADVDPRGNPQSVTPPFAGTTMYWSKANYTLAAGAQTIRLNRVGNFIRTLILTFQDASGVRDGTQVPDPVELRIDSRIVLNQAGLLTRSVMAKRYGYALAGVNTADVDEGVYVFDFTHDFDGKPGGEMRDLWLPTVQSTRLEIVGSIAAAGSVNVLTNDVAPAAGAVGLR